MKIGTSVRAYFSRIAGIAIAAILLLSGSSWAGTWMSRIGISQPGNHSGGLVQNGDGSYFLYGETPTVNWMGGTLTKLDANGGILWSTQLSEPYSGGLDKTSDGGAIVTTGGSYQRNDTVVKIDSAGNLVAQYRVPYEVTFAIVSGNALYLCMWNGLGGTGAVVARLNMLNWTVDWATSITVANGGG